jgi:hypothetical protein
MEKLVKTLKEDVIVYLVKSGNLDEPYIIAGKEVFSKKRIIHEIENDTVEGKKFISNLVILSLDLFNRGKETTTEFKKV